MTVRPSIRAIHRWAGLVLGLLVAVICLSGSTVVLINDLERWIHAAPPAVRGAPAAGEPRVGFDLVVGRLKAAFPGCSPDWYSTAAMNDAIDVVWMAEPVADGGEETYFRAFVDPRSGELLGSSRGSRVSAVLDWLADLHMTLFAGAVGTVVIGSTGLLLTGFTVTGLILWWPGLRRWGTAFRLRWAAGGFLRHYDAHRVVGVASAPLLVVIAISGTMFYFDWTRNLVFNALGGRREELRAWMRPEDQQPKAIVKQGPPLPMDRLAERALAVAPGLTVAAIVTHTHAADEPWEVQCTYAGNLDPQAGGVVVHLDPVSGAVLLVEDGRGGSAGKWVAHHSWALHAGWWGVPGAWWGWVLRALYMVIGTAPTVLLVTGVGIWLHRRRLARVARALRAELPGHA